MATGADPQGRPPGIGRLYEAVAAWSESARGLASTFLQDFRRSDRFFRMRVSIFAAWGVLSFATLVWTCVAVGRGNSLGAEVKVNRDSIMGVQILVRNESGHVWEDVTLTLDDGWTYRQRTMRPEDHVIPMDRFTKVGEPPPPDHEPRSLGIECSRGSARFELH